MPKGRHISSYTRVGAVLAVVVISAVCIFIFTNRHTVTGTPLVLGKGTASAATYSLEKVTDVTAQQQGLSGRSGLGKQAGMLFSYDQPTQHCMWMKDMKFNIDIVWFDANHRISSIVPDLSPSTYPQTYCADARYVVELPAGAAKAHGLRVGSIVNFGL